MQPISKYSKLAENSYQALKEDLTKLETCKKAEIKLICTNLMADIRGLYTAFDKLQTVSRAKIEPEEIGNVETLLKKAKNELMTELSVKALKIPSNEAGFDYSKFMNLITTLDERSAESKNIEGDIFDHEERLKQLDEKINLIQTAT